LTGSCGIIKRSTPEDSRQIRVIEHRLRRLESRAVVPLHYRVLSRGIWRSIENLLPCLAIQAVSQQASTFGLQLVFQQVSQIFHSLAFVRKIVPAEKLRITSIKLCAYTSLLFPEWEKVPSNL
jgi:hypothetical protein